MAEPESNDVTSTRYVWLTVVQDDTLSRGGIKFSWGQQTGPKGAPYVVDRQFIENVVDEFGHEFVNLVNAQSSAPTVQINSVTATAVAKLAKVGSKLRRRIFRPVLPAQLPDAQKAETLLDARAGEKIHLSISCDSLLHIPWGLIFNGDPSQLPTNTLPRNESTLSHYSGFWYFQYDLSTVFQGHPNDGTYEIDALVLSVVDKEAFKDAMGIDPELVKNQDARTGANCRTQSTTSLDAYRRVFQAPLGLHYSFNDVSSRIDDGETYGSDVVVHFLGHGQPDALRANGQVFESDDFTFFLEELLERSKGLDRESQCLVFLNCCDGLVGAMESLRQCTSHYGVTGVISTECKIPKNFAGLYGGGLMKRLIDDKMSLGEAMSDMRSSIDYWPTSLLYGCYANPSTWLKIK